MNCNNLVEDVMKEICYSKCAFTIRHQTAWAFRFLELIIPQFQKCLGHLKFKAGNLKGCNCRHFKMVYSFCLKITNTMQPAVLLGGHALFLLLILAFLRRFRVSLVGRLPLMYLVRYIVWRLTKKNTTKMLNGTANSLELILFAALVLLFDFDPFLAVKWPWYIIKI